MCIVLFWPNSNSFLEKYAKCCRKLHFEICFFFSRSYFIVFLSALFSLFADVGQVHTMERDDGRNGEARRVTEKVLLLTANLFRLFDIDTTPTRATTKTAPAFDRSAVAIGPTAVREKSRLADVLLTKKFKGQRKREALCIFSLVLFMMISLLCLSLLLSQSLYVFVCAEKFLPH